MCDNGLQLAYLNRPTVNGINLPDLLITLSAYQNYRRIRDEKLPRLYIMKSWRRLQNVYFRFRMAQREVPIVRAKSAFKLAQLTRPVGLLECRSKRLSEMQHSHNQNVLLHAPSVKSPRRPRQHV